MSKINAYRCKHPVEAMRWDGTSRELLTAWHEKHTGKTPWCRTSVACGELAVVYLGDAWREIEPGEWLVWSSDEFLVMDDEQFRETYEEG